MHNTFTYRYSDLPPVPPATQAEIAALDVHIADLILKCQGNYRALEQLGEILDNCLDSYQLNLNSIRIIPDDSPRPPAVSLKDLSLEEKPLIHSCSFTNSLLLNMLADALGTNPEYLAKDIAAQVLVHHKPVADSDAETQEAFLVIKEAKSRGLLQKQPPDRCLNPYINAANRILESFETEAFEATLLLNISHAYAYVALVATNTIRITTA